MNEKRYRNVDVIAQHTSDGHIIPIKIRTKDEEGEYQTFTIKGFKDLTHQGVRTMPDGVFVHDNTIVFECCIEVFGTRRIIRLYYDNRELIWHMTA